MEAGVPLEIDLVADQNEHDFLAGCEVLSLLEPAVYVFEGLA
jgi:hypothetical protein